MTITEGLAEIKTIWKRVEKKIDFLTAYVARYEQQKDPLVKQGGAEKIIKEERQAIADLLRRVIAIRMAIAKANSEKTAVVCGQTRTIAEWLVWKREIASHEEEVLKKLANQIKIAREQAKKQGTNIISSTAAVATTAEQNPLDIVVTVDEKEISDSLEKLDEIKGSLDGQLSLINATTQIGI